MSENLIFDQSQLEATSVTYSLDTFLLSEKRATYSLSVRFVGNLTAHYNMTTRIGAPQNSYDMDVRVVYDRSAFQLVNPLISSLYWACASMSDDIEIRAKQMSSKFKIQYASGSQLDDYFGRTINLRRRYQETDDSYRRRIQTYIAILVSSGTKNDILSILDAFVDSSNSATLKVVWPATVYIRWNSADLMLAALQNETALDFICTEMFAAGVDWKFILKYVEYKMDARFTGKGRKTYDMSSLIKIVKTQQYKLDTSVLRRSSKTYSMRTAMMKTNLMMYFMYAEPFLKINHITYDMGTINEKTFTVPESMDCLAEKSLLADYSLRVISEKRFSITEEYDSRFVRTTRAFYAMGTMLEGWGGSVDGYSELHGELMFE